MMMVSGPEVVCPGLLESLTCSVTVALPAVVGVPLTVQPLRTRPPGSVPVMEQVYGEVPPLIPIGAVYGTPTVPFGRVVVVRISGGELITMVSLALGRLCRRT